MSRNSATNQQLHPAALFQTADWVQKVRWFVPRGVAKELAIFCLGYSRAG